MIQFFLATLTGVLGFLSFPSYALDFCVWLTLVPLLVAVSATSLRRAPSTPLRTGPSTPLRTSFWLGCLAAVVGFCGAFPWVVPTIARFEDVSLLRAFVFAVPAAAYHALQLGIFAAFAAWALTPKSNVQRSRSKVRKLQPRTRDPAIRLMTDRPPTLQCFNGSMTQSPFGPAEQPALGTPHAIVAVLSVASAWVVLEWSFPKVFPWSFATVLSDRVALIQIVEVTGVWGLSFVIAAVNAALAIGIVSWRNRRHVAWRPLALAASLVLAVWGFGSARLKDFGETSALDLLTRREGTPAPEIDRFWRRAALSPLFWAKPQGERGPEDSPGPPLTITAVQGNIGAGPRDPVVEGQTFSVYRQLTVRPPGVSHLSAFFDAAQDRLRTQDPSTGLRAGSALIIWPETTIRAVLPETQHYREALFDVAEQLRRPMLVGSLDAADHGQAEFNSLFVIAPDRKLAGVYHKTRLLPFGESAPLFGSWWRTTGRFTNGESPKVLPVPILLSTQDPSTVLRTGSAPFDLAQDRLSTVLIAPSICYEALFPGFFNDLVRQGAEFLVNITDDSWFGNGNAPWQHLQGAIFRAVETRRTLVRASNSGISAVIAPSGRITARTELFTRTVMQGVVTPGRGETLYVRWGDWFAWLCLAMVLLLSIIRWRWLPPLTPESRR